MYLSTFRASHKLQPSGIYFLSRFSVLYMLWRATQYKVEMRTAAYVTAVKKIVGAMRALGRI